MLISTSHTPRSSWLSLMIRIYWTSDFCCALHFINARCSFSTFLFLQVSSSFIFLVKESVFCYFGIWLLACYLFTKYIISSFCLFNVRFSWIGDIFLYWLSSIFFPLLSVILSFSWVGYRFSAILTIISSLVRNQLPHTPIFLNLFSGNNIRYFLVLSVLYFLFVHFKSVGKFLSI